MHVFAELSILIAIAAGISAIMRLLKQPLIIGHILTGLIVGPLALGLIQSIEIFTLFGEMGIAILLFTVGLNLNPGVIKEFGMVSVITGLGQVTFTAIVGYLISAAVGFPPLTSLYLGIALSFSSTIIILKLITDKGDLESLYAKISIGFLLVQDLIAIMLLFAIPLLSAETSPSNIIFLLLRGLALLLAVYFGARLLMPKLNNFLSQSLELLFIFAIAWGTGVAALFQSVGFSIESGALIAGVALSTLPSRHEISARLMPLRDFFIVLFFILLGSQMQIANIGSNILIALILSVLVLVGNPLILMAIMGLSGYKKRPAFRLVLRWRKSANSPLF